MDRSSPRQNSDLRKGLLQTGAEIVVVFQAACPHFGQESPPTDFTRHIEAQGMALARIAGAGMIKMI